MSAVAFAARAAWDRTFAANASSTGDATNRVQRNHRPIQRIQLLFVLGIFAGCTSTARREAPPELLSEARPDGFPAAVRLLSPDLAGFDERAPILVASVRQAAPDGVVNILALSGGGAGGAFGAGSLYGLTRSRARPDFQLVTGVSAGALIAPFAFLGPEWDNRLKDAFAGEQSLSLPHSVTTALLSRLFSPLGARDRSALSQLVDSYVTSELVDAVARETARGKRLIVATTDLDKQETVLWNMGVIAARGGKAARILFRDVLVASASVPGVFPPVLIHVREEGRRYDELHADGSITTPLFAMPLMAAFHPAQLSELHGARLYALVNGKLARVPTTTPINTPTILARSLSAGTTYRTREALVATIALSRKLGMTLSLTEIPAEYPEDSFLDFDKDHMRRLFDFGRECAERGLLWMTPEQSVHRNIGLLLPVFNAPQRCPGEQVPDDPTPH